MTTKKKTKTVKKKTMKHPHPLRTAKPPPKTLFAAIDPQGSLRFSTSDEVSINAFVGKLNKFYRIEKYDIVEKDPGRRKHLVKSKPARKKEKRK